MEANGFGMCAARNHREHVVCSMARVCALAARKLDSNPFSVCKPTLPAACRARHTLGDYGPTDLKRPRQHRPHGCFLSFCWSFVSCCSCFSIRVIIFVSVLYCHFVPFSPFCCPFESSSFVSLCSWLQSA